MTSSALHSSDSVTSSPKEPRVGGFSHLTVQVTDLDRSEKFYQDVFGLDLIGRNLINEGPRNSLLAMNTRHRVVLVEVPEVQPFRPNSNSIHHAWYLTPEQFDRAEQRLKEAGFEIGDSRAQFRPLGERNIDVFDPDGHRYQVQVHGPESREVIVEDVGEVPCGNMHDYAVGDVRSFVKGKFFVIRLKEGFIALSRWCTHKNGLVMWKQEHWQFRCPMHGVTYNRKGEPTSYCRDVPPMRMHPLVIANDGTITVRPGEVIQREAFDPDQVVRVAVAPC
jgi:catechol 2,3-dioxygenase-like lactoylglutathione lyase family enzyme